MGADVICFIVFFVITLFSVVISNVDDFEGVGVVAFFTGPVCLEILLWNSMLLSYLQEWTALANGLLYVIGYVITWLIIVLFGACWSFYKKDLK